LDLLLFVVFIVVVVVVVVVIIIVVVIYFLWYALFLLERCSTIRSIHGRKIFHTWEESEKLMKLKLDATQVITHNYPMSEFELAFDALISGKAIKVLINPQL
jgi:threonine dehydrogenase-like Zn-dependent dehydrogenase